MRSIVRLLGSFFVADEQDKHLPDDYIGSHTLSCWLGLPISRWILPASEFAQPAIELRQRREIQPLSGCRPKDAPPYRDTIGTMVDPK